MEKKKKSDWLKKFTHQEGYSDPDIEPLVDDTKEETTDVEQIIKKANDEEKSTRKKD